MQTSGTHHKNMLLRRHFKQTIEHFGEDFVLECIYALQHFCLHFDANVGCNGEVLSVPVSSSTVKLKEVSK